MKGKILTGVLILMFVSPNANYACPNIPPGVTITAPSEGAVFIEGDDILTKINFEEFVKIDHMRTTIIIVVAIFISIYPKLIGENYSTKTTGF